ITPSNRRRSWRRSITAWASTSTRRWCPAPANGRSAWWTPSRSGSCSRNEPQRHKSERRQMKNGERRTENGERSPRVQHSPHSRFSVLRSPFFIGLLCFTVSLWCNPLGATEPVVRNLNVRGLQVGATTTLILDGDDFGTAPRLLLPFAAQQ